MHFSWYSSYVISCPIKNHRFTTAYLRCEGRSWTLCSASCFVAFLTDRKQSKSSRADFFLIEILLCALFVMFSSGWNQRCLHVVSSSKAPQRQIWGIGFLYSLLLQNIRQSFGLVSGRKKPIISRYFNLICMFVLLFKLYIDKKSKFQWMKIIHKLEASFMFCQHFKILLFGLNFLSIFFYLISLETGMISK